MLKVCRKLQGQFTALVRTADFELHGWRVASRACTGKSPQVAHNLEARRDFAQVEDREGAFEEGGAAIPTAGIGSGASDTSAAISTGAWQKVQTNAAVIEMPLGPAIWR